MSGRPRPGNAASLPEMLDERIREARGILGDLGKEIAAARKERDSLIQVTAQSVADSVAAQVNQDFEEHIALIRQVNKRLTEVATELLAMAGQFKDPLEFRKWASRQVDKVVKNEIRELAYQFEESVHQAKEAKLTVRDIFGGKP